MANIAPNITSVGISCEPPPPPAGEGAIAHAMSGKKRLIGQSGYPIVRENIAREKTSSEGVEGARGDRLAHGRHETEIEAHVVQREQPILEQLLGEEQMAQIRMRARVLRVALSVCFELCRLADPVRGPVSDRPGR